MLNYTPLERLLMFALLFVVLILISLVLVFSHNQDEILRLRTKWKIHGMILDESGKGEPGAVVIIYQIVRGPFVQYRLDGGAIEFVKIKSNENGKFEISTRSKGDFYIFAYRQSNAFCSGMEHIGELRSGELRSITIKLDPVECAMKDKSIQ